ncbi:1830_t:CDS:2 [Racocetra persica]|uniref:1830_t:CDS:1 n=1 Tax=Racocetra persica TaxID=160502 RepID=A0ACA9PXL1_9GLOM|nr:1830_t:CDS:2 [Racocetra persica]
MDTSIIVLFKLHYRYLQLQHAIDRDETRKKDIYKVNQLQRCWFRMKVVSPRDESRVPVAPTIVESIDDFTNEDLIQAAIEVEQVEEEFVMPPLTGEEQLNILRSALRIVDERIDNGGIIIKSLRKLQSCIREKVWEKKDKKQVQHRLDQYFT